ncbi:unnamed protein product [Effrenium voratum]|uniref:Enoyl-CoA hydratase n=1 Tax=Effrenium voratum TaxID=2562239 RepID=A0AA36JG23_9DINO|nr:unnamed protein product [Effrenium voratum]CAJ1404715.1 unnamed protein product [Effrenium voratum]CAJ1422446.1 unnamed protein product [Effrenium voratum]
MTPKYAEKYKTIRLDTIDGVCVATMDSGDKGGVNLITGKLFKEFGDMVKNVARDDSIRVLVVRSANEHFWLAHLDVRSILEEPNPPVERGQVLNQWHSNMEILRNMPKPTIAELAGRVGGGGHEFAMNFDMRFGLYGATQICQMEVPLGIIPGGGACANLQRFLGAGRAMEVILAGEDLSAETAERWGLLNRCFQSRGELQAHVETLAQRLASFAPEAIRCAKEAVLAAERMPHSEALKENLMLFYRSLRGPQARTRMEAFLREGGQTLEGELDLQKTLSKL